MRSASCLACQICVVSCLALGIVEGSLKAVTSVRCPSLGQSLLKLALPFSWPGYLPHLALLVNVEILAGEDPVEFAAAAATVQHKMDNGGESQS